MHNIGYKMYAWCGMIVIVLKINLHLYQSMSMSLLTKYYMLIDIGT